VIALVDALTGVVCAARRATTLCSRRTANLVAPGFVTDLIVPRQRQAPGHQLHRRHRALLGPSPSRKQIADLPHGSKVEEVFAAGGGTVLYSQGLGLIRRVGSQPARVRPAPRARRQAGT